MTDGPTLHDEIIDQEKRWNEAVPAYLRCDHLPVHTEIVGGSRRKPSRADIRRSAVALLYRTGHYRISEIARALKLSYCHVCALIRETVLREDVDR